MENWLLRAVKQNPEGLAMLYNDEFISYSTLYQRSLDIASKLKQKGVKKNQHVGILMDNSDDYVYCIYALTMLGSVLIPLNTRLSTAEIEAQIDHADITLLISDRADTFACEMLMIDVLKKINTTDEIEPVDIDLNQLHSIVFTSGTTGNPKGVRLSYENHHASALASAEVLGVQSNDRWLNCISLFHVGGLEIVFRSCIYGTAFVLHKRFDEQKVVHSLYEDNITLVSLVPTMLYRILEKNSLYPVPENLRCILLGGAKTPERLVDRALDKDLPIALTYGMTESCSQIATATKEIITQKRNSVGKALPGIELRINKLRGENFGEIEVRGDPITQGYYKQPEVNQLRFVDGFFKTGDLGYLDGDNYLYMLQRKYDMIITGGENVIPSEVEEIIIQIDGVDACIVFGIHHEEWGQEIHLGLLGRKIISIDEIQRFCKGKLANYKIPRKIHHCNRFIYTGSGKMNRKATIEHIIGGNC